MRAHSTKHSTAVASLRDGRQLGIRRQDLFPSARATRGNSDAVWPLIHDARRRRFVALRGVILALVLVAGLPFSVTDAVSDTTPPSVVVTSPASGATVSGTITVSASVFDMAGVAGVRFKYNGADFGAEATTAPYSVSWNTTTAANGSHTLAAVARDAAGNLTTSAPVTVTVANETTPPPDATAPSTPTGLTASAVTQSSLTLSWSAANDNVAVTGYRVYRDGTLVASPTSTSASITGLLASTTYSFTVSAVDAAGNASAQSAPASATTQSTRPDVVVTSLSYANGIFTSTVRNQGAVATPTGVDIGVAYFVDGVYRTWGGSFTSLAAGASVTIGSDGGAYSIPAGTHTIRAYVDDAHRITESDENNNQLSQSITIGASDTTAPSTPTGLTATAVSSSQINLAWTAATDDIGVTGYRVYRGGSLLTTLGNVTTYQNTGLTPSTNYSYTVQAIDAAGNASAQSAPASATTQSTLPDVVVTSLSYANGIFTSTVRNQGAVATPTGVDIGVAYFVDNVYRTWGGSFTSLAAGASVTIGSDGGAYSIPAGTHTIRAYVDDAHRITESDENNNQLSQSITIGASDAPTVSLSASPATITAGQSSTLTWSSTDADSCTAFGGWSGTKANSGSQTVTPSVTTTYILSCTGAGGITSKNANVTVTTSATPTVSLSASPATITAGQSSTLTWSSTGANSCTASGGWSGATANSGSQTVTPSATTTYTLTCTGGGGSTSESATVTVTATGAVTPSLVASRVSGVAPLAVFFDATGTTAAATTRPFHDLEYRWDFGDPAGEATWSTGSNAGVSSKNSATGPVAAHVYETTGTYTVTLTAFDGTNTDTTTVSITVDNPDVVFAAGKTRCLSNLNIFTGCPAGATQVPVAASGLAAAIAAHQGANRRILLRRGETWTVTSQAVINQNGPGILGAFGSGARPVIRATGNNRILQLSSAATPSVKDWRVMDLELDGQNGTSTEGVQAQGGADQVTLLRLNIHDVHFGVLFSDSILDYYNGSGGTHTIWDQLAIVDSTVSHAVGGTGGYGAYVSARRFSFLGNAISDSTNAEHLLRTPYIGKGVISNSTFSNPAPHKHAIKMHASTFGSAGVNGGGFTEQVAISDNKFTGGAGTAWTVTLGPQDEFADERVRDVVVERNWFTAGSETQVALVVFASEVTVRNNICDMTGGFGATCFSVTRRGIEPAPNNVRIYNNTAFRADFVSEFKAISLGSAATNATVRNNLGSAPNATTRTMIVGTPPGLVQSNNLMNNSPAALFVTAAPTVPADFQLQALPNPASDTGFATVPVFSDFFRSSRPQNGVIDIGAAEGP